MRVEVLRVVDHSRGVVSFRCESGVASGRWMGSNPASVGQVDVEIEVPEEVTEWVVALSGVASLSEVAGAESVTLITGEVVKSDDGDDSVVEMRVGSDILLIEIPNQKVDLPVGGFISFRVPEVQLYPYDL